jgi:hypothetical protein
MTILVFFRRDEAEATSFYNTIPPLRYYEGFSGVLVVARTC